MRLDVVRACTKPHRRASPNRFHFVCPGRYDVIASAPKPNP